MEQGHTNIRVLIADDHAFFRESVRAMCAARGGAEVVAEVDNGQDAAESVRRTRPDVVLLDLHMPGPDSAQVIRRIGAKYPHVRVIGLTMDRHDPVVRAAREAGAWECLLKDVEADVFMEAVESAYHGRAPLSPAVADDSLSQRQLGHVVGGYFQWLSDLLEDEP